jgi:hypothetical protein
LTFYVTVTEGASEGKTFRVEPGECVVGRAPSSTIVLEDESIAWEHALLREDNGRLILQNLSAQGTRVKGRRITDEVKLSSNDEVELSDQCKVVVHQRLRRGARRLSKRTSMILAVGGMLIVLGAAVVWMVRPAEPPPPPLTLSHWQQAYKRIEHRMGQWTQKRVFPEEALAVYREAWRLEQALNPEAAALKWEQMRALLLTLPVPTPGDDTRIAEHAGTTVKALRVIMGRDRESRSTEYRWNTDEAYADALVWFVRLRAEECRRQAEERR